MSNRLFKHFIGSCINSTKAPMQPSEWADQYRMLSVSSSSEPGRWRTKRTPYLKEIMNNLHPYSPVKRVVLMKGHQVGYTEGVLMNGLGYIMSENPGPTMFVAPSEKAVKKMLQQKIEPMIYDTPKVRKLMPKTSRATHRSTLIHKDFLGGFLVLCGATVPSDLAGTSVRFLFLDEVDRMGLDVEGEGSPVELAIGRTAAYKRKKIFMGSTPVSEETSVIKHYFEDGDQRYYYVPCPKCKHMQTLEIDRLDYSDLANIFYRCEKCDEKINESHKTLMLESGKWRPTADAHPENRSYHLNALYSPVGFLPWLDVARMAIKSKRDDSSAQTFANLYLGLPRSLSNAEVPVPEILMLRENTYEKRKAPCDSSTFNIGSVDVQGDRLEALIVRWDKRQAFVDDHVILYGNTNSDPGEEPWAQLTHLMESYEGGMHVLGIDSGYIPHRVFSWYKSLPQEVKLRVRVIRGVSSLEGLMSPPKLMDVSIYSGKKSKVGNKYYDLNTHILKMEVHKRLLLSDENSSEYIHFPTDLGEEFYHQLCSERMILHKSDVMDRTGLPRYRWVAVRNRNEAFDLMVYNLGLWYGSGAARWVDKWEDFLDLKSQYLRIAT